ncbi:ATP-binding protein [Devosia sp. LjRoot3]|uniref:ATP-binding protein n=1 Tax=Devosia sp. LjRoot3 TaxID=3342319 RepID=UPI003ECF12A6
MAENVRNISLDAWDPVDDEYEVEQGSNVAHLAAVKAKISELRKMYINTSRDASLNEQFERLLEEKESGAPERRWAGLLVKAPSGFGKSRMLREFFETHPMIHEYGSETSNLLAIQVPSPVTNRSLGLAVVRTMYPQKTDRGNRGINKDSALSDIWSEARNLSEELGVLGLWIDESHDLAVGGEKTLKLLQLTFKRWMGHAHRPLLILSGTPEIEGMFTTRELRRRFLDVDCPDLSAEADQDDLKRVIAKYLRKAELGIDASLEHLMGRLVHAGTRQLGWTCDLVIEAIREALLTRSDQLAMKHFASSYEAIVKCSDNDNPFIAGDWSGIDTVLQRVRVITSPPPAPKRRLRRELTPW